MHEIERMPPGPGWLGSTQATYTVFSVLICSGYIIDQTNDSSRVVVHHLVSLPQAGRAALVHVYEQSIQPLPSTSPPLC